MPTYEYQCADCGHRFEKVQPITARALTRCPECKGRVKRLVSGGAGLIFKGSGFHATDYRSAGYKKKARSEDGGKATPGAGDGSGKATPKAGDGGSCPPGGCGSCGPA
ncbi:MAG: zinc ribbon domain-containing protein [Candidatus Eisenbacteria bacterium]|nr:zinc ribbon domain-containing protein [Candidatus Eisenbacteria bacterium]